MAGPTRILALLAAALSLPVATADPGSETQAAVAAIEASMVRIPFSTPFAIARFEVTQKQWRALMGNDPGRDLTLQQGCDECAVGHVSWDDAKKFIAKLNGITGGGYRLPTADEWEFACQASGNHRHCGSDNIDEIAWIRDNSGDRVHPVGQKKPNAWGLYDMSGNVFEWTQDCVEGNVFACDTAVMKGGAADGTYHCALNETRSNVMTRSRAAIDGFRVARTVR
jgi:formylglycine-generating enzyme required for sulfatase activity